MKNIDTFPVINANDVHTVNGMTLLDYFAAKAMQGLVVNTGRNGYGMHKPDLIAEDCYNLAKAMLLEREKVMKEIKP